MPRTHVVPLAGAALAASIPAGQIAPAAAAFSLDVMTFNIRTSYVSDGDNAWPNRKALVADTIARFAPQVVGLQEALDEQIAYLASALPAYRWLGVDRGLNGGTGLSEYTPIFYRHGELVPIESGNFWLSSAPDATNAAAPPGTRGRGARIVTWARFHHVATGRQVHVFNTHFTLRRGQTQIDSLDLITARVAALPPGIPVVVMGDFNAPAEESDVWQAAVGRGLRDAWVVAGERRGPVSTSNGFGPPRDGNTERIDWILIGGPVQVRSAETVLHHDNGRYPSDHYPVVANLEIHQ
jgi:endonuclease/exonuclease/phosphatase family metal-dependent hydrolase